VAVEKVSVFKSAFLLISLWMGGDGNDYHMFQGLKFDNKQACVIYVIRHIRELNNHMAKEYGSKLDINNKFWCIDSKELRKRLEKTIQLPL